ncbi:cellulose binding domain-containing protein [Streptomyces sp. NPDC059352]|uniref:cellulose binding domain-containing protein n=1 Tax=Streptomyces sp. NPDC059352 TaxID=3346810 RepID=UPI0036804F27
MRGRSGELRRRHLLLDPPAAPGLHEGLRRLQVTRRPSAPPPHRAPRPEPPHPPAGARTPTRPHRATGTAALNGWTVRWSRPAGRRVTRAWNAAVTQTGAEVTAANLSYNVTVPPGGSVSFGSNGARSGTNPPPAAFTCG